MTLYNTVGTTKATTGWNLFARVLQEVLANYGLSLGHLDDRVKIHPEKVRRLQRSLLLLMTTIDASVKCLEAWQVWYNEAERGLETAMHRLAEPGA